jgi:hypothetical protein
MWRQKNCCARRRRRSTEAAQQGAAERPCCHWLATQTQKRGRSATSSHAPWRTMESQNGDQCTQQSLLDAGAVFGAILVFDVAKQLIDVLRNKSKRNNPI